MCAPHSPPNSTKAKHESHRSNQSASVHPTTEHDTRNSSKDDNSKRELPKLGLCEMFTRNVRGNNIRITNKTARNVFILLSEDEAVVTYEQAVEAKAGAYGIKASGKRGKKKVYVYDGESSINIPPQGTKEVNLHRTGYYMTIVSHTKTCTGEGRKQNAFIVHEHIFVGKHKYEISNDTIENELEVLSELN